MQKIGMDLTASVQDTLTRIPSSGPVSAWQFLQALLSIHREYGDGLAGRLVSEAGPEGGATRPADEWLNALMDLFDVGRVPTLHGRLVVLGLARLDPPLRSFLQQRGFLTAVRRELKEDFDSLLVDPGELLAGAWNDHVRRGAVDLLDIEHEVRTIANLIASKRVSMPLSLGLFGDWGTGKTFFITKLREHITGICSHHRAVEEQSGVVSEWCTRVLHIEFNAWHYSDSNLWATLVARIHGELRNKIEPKEDLKQRLEDEAKRAREASREAAAQIDIARKRVERANDKLRTTRAQLEQRQNTLRGMIGSLSDLLSSDEDAPVMQKLDSAAKAVGIPEAADAYDSLVELNQRISSTAGRAAAVLRSMAGMKQVALLAVALIAAPLLLTWLLSLPFDLTAIGQSVIQISGVIVGGATWLLGYIDRGAKHLAVIEDALTRAQDAREREIREHPETANAARDVVVAQAEEESARQALESAQNELQRVQTELDELNPERRLLRLLEERSRSGAYTKHLGIISLIREDFESISELLLQLESERTDGTTMPPVQRIILYIDDLDRCRPDRVVQVLEAVHMLLTFPIFTVVVGVDPRWLRQSLLVRYPKNLSMNGNEEDDATEATPQNYLEKIFQIPFALRRVEEQGYRTLVGDLLKPPPGIHGRSPDEVDTAAPAGGNGAMGALHGHQNMSQAPQQNVQRRPASAMPVSTQQIEFTDAEKADIACLWPLFTTPRSVKRFINTYRLLRVGVAAAARDDYEQGEYQLPLMLLAVITSSPNEMHLFHSAVVAWHAELDPDARARRWSWTELFDAVREPIAQLDRDWAQIDAAVRSILAGGFQHTFEPAKLHGWVTRVSRFSFAVIPPRANVVVPRRRAEDHGRLEVEPILRP